MTWQRVCAIAEIANNTVKKIEFDGVSFVLANYGEGFRAFPPFCPHMQEPLEVSGMIDDGVLTCIKHVWQWDLRSGEKTGLTEEDILFYDLKEDNGEIFIDLSQELVYAWEEEEESDDDDFFGSD